MSEEIEKLNAKVPITNNEEPNGEATCRIHFENNQNRVYYTGQVVTGRVNLVINEATTVRAIYANVVGRGYCNWKTYSGSGRTRSTRHNSKEEFYINRKFYYVGNQNNISGRTTVQPGDYNYHFECNIPDECHTSFEEDTGFIRYYVTVIIEEDDDKKKEFIESFTVINPLNLNDDETLSYPMNDDAELTFNKYCCMLCCWETEPLKISVKVPMKGYAPGQVIQITIKVDNKSDQTLNKFIGNIFKKIEFYTGDKTSTSTEKIITCECEGCPAGQTLSRLLSVTVPPTPRTETSNICSISYQLTVEAFADCCRDDFKLEFPLTIGSFPILNPNIETGNIDIVVTQQPTKQLSNGGNVNETQIHQQVLSEPSQPLLIKENILSQQHSQDTSLDGTQSEIGIKSPEFRIGESSRSDKELANSFRPMHPTYTNNQYPLACTLTVEAGEVKPIKM